MRIENIERVMPFVSGRSDFIVMDKGDYIVIDYVVNTSDTFDEPIRRECRGIKFNRDGKLIARPLHKFFNYGERVDVEYDFSEPHVILDKLDGSMVHSVVLNNELRLMTRKGITDVSKAAERLLTEEQKECLYNYYLLGMTVTLEYIGPENQIVLFYEKPELVILAVRGMFSGRYHNERDLIYYHNIGNPFLIFAKPISYPAPLTNEMIKTIRDMADVEGVVVQFHSGEMVKIKCEDYVTKHRVATGQTHEIHYVDAILDGFFDDVISYKSGEFKTRLIEFNDKIVNAINEYFKTVDGIVKMGEGVDQKTFATEFVDKVPRVYRSSAFKLRKLYDINGTVNGYEFAIGEFKRIFKTQKDLEENRDLLWGAKILLR